MSLKSLIASATLSVFLASFCLAEAPMAPGKSIPADVPAVEEEIPLVLNSASAEPAAFISMTDVKVTPSSNTAEVRFTTNIPTYATIEYGLTTELESAVTTETMTAHVETLSGLTACHTYSYRVLATSADDTALDTAREGTFTTKGCVVKKLTPVVKKTVPTPTPVIDLVAVPPVVEVSVPESEIITLPLESDIPLNAAPDEIQNENVGVTPDTLQAAPESPDAPAFIPEPIEKPESRATETALALLGMLLLVGALIVIRRKR